MQTIGFIGAGNMAYAIISGLINNGKSANFIKISDTNHDLLLQREAQFNLETFKSNAQLASACDVVVLAVKPQVLPKVCQELTQSLAHKPLIISIVAGVRIDDIDRWLGLNNAIVRTMPNTPASLNQGVTALFANDCVSLDEKVLAETILASVGVCLWLEAEPMLDAVTALSGSGPGYFFLMIESMTEAGVVLGLDKEIAQRLSIQTALGASMMASQMGDSPRQLRTDVTSPHGTTEAAIESLQEQNFEAVVVRAIRVAFERAQEIGNELSNYEE